MERRNVPVQSKPIVTISVIMDDEYTQGVDSVPVKQAWKDPIDEHRIPDGITLTIRVARKTTIPAMLEAAVLVICDGSGILCVETHPYLKRRRLVFVARRIAEVMPNNSLHVKVSHFAEREMHLPRGIIEAQGSLTVAWLTTIRND